MRALFLDRDGVVNLDTKYTYKVSDLVLVDGITNLIKFFRGHCYKIIVVSNQSGIGRGYYSFDDWNNFNLAINNQLAANGCKIDKFYCCPHFTEVRHKTISCRCRKPNPGLFLDAKLEFKINLSKSLMIGDKPTDIYAADNAGLDRAYLLDSHDILVQLKNNINWKRISSLKAILEIEKSFIR